MMHVNSGQHKQHLEDLRREAENERLAHEMHMPDHPDLGLLQPVAAGFWGWLSQIISPQVSSEQAPMHREWD